jgi:hypothetical protein
MHLQKVENKIFKTRHQKVMLDFDLAELYAVEMNQSQFITSYRKHSSTIPYAFTAQGIAMLSATLKVQRAIEVNIFIMRGFVFMRQYTFTCKYLTNILKQFEKNMVNNLKIYTKLYLT